MISWNVLLESSAVVRRLRRVPCPTPRLRRATVANYRYGTDSIPGAGHVGDTLHDAAERFEVTGPGPAEREGFRLKKAC